MKILSGLAFVITLIVALVSWGLYVFEPNLLIGTPWGSWHLSFWIVGSFVLGIGVFGVYVFSGWINYQTSLRRRGRELRQTKSELETLKKQQIQEVPVIPDRPQ